MATEVFKDDQDAVSALNLLHNARSEIMVLKQQIRELRPKAEAYEALLIVMGLLPQQSMQMSQDLPASIEKFTTSVDADRRKREAEKAAQPKQTSYHAPASVPLSD